MNPKVMLVFIMVAISLCLLACAPAAPSQVSVDGSYDGKTVELAAGGSLTVTLESNATTGFQWELASISDQTVMEKVANTYEAPEAKEGETPMVGAGGQEVWTFQALTKGEATISMEYSRPWEKGEKADQTFSLTVVVQ